MGSCIALHVYSATMLRDIVGQVATLHSDHAAAREDSASPAVWDAVVGEHAILNLHLAAGHVQRTRKVLNKRALVEHEPATAHHHRWSGECLTNLHTLEGDLASGDVDYGRRCGGVRVKRLRWRDGRSTTCTPGAAESTTSLAPTDPSKKRPPSGTSYSEASSVSWTGVPGWLLAASLKASAKPVESDTVML